MPTTSLRPVSDTAFRLLADHFGDAEVRDLHPALFVEQDVLRLDVAVDDALLVGVLQRLANLRHDGQRLVRRNLAGQQQLAQIQAIHKFHQQVITVPARSRRSHRR